MEFQEFVKEKNRMCNSNIECSQCGFLNGDCYDFVLNHPKEAEEIVKKWSAEHPAITNKQHYIDVMKKEFGFEDKNDLYKCPPHIVGQECVGECTKCERWWNHEYKAPKQL